MSPAQTTRPSGRATEVVQQKGQCTSARSRAGGAGELPSIGVTGTDCESVFGEVTRGVGAGGLPAKPQL